MGVIATPRSGAPVRSAVTRSVLMCEPRFFDVAYQINPWMDPRKPVDQARAVRQWRTLADTYRRLGHTVHLIDPLVGLPDMVFITDPAIVVGEHVIAAQWRQHQRAEESAAALRRLRRLGYTPIDAPRHWIEGGDVLTAAGRALCGYGPRTDIRAHRELTRITGWPVTSLHLTDPRFFHLDTALLIASDDTAAYWPGAFDEPSRQALRALFPDAITVSETDAVAFALNAVSDGHHIVLPAGAPDLATALAQRGFQPITVEVDELTKAGGAVRCCTLTLPDHTTGITWQ